MLAKPYQEIVAYLEEQLIGQPRAIEQLKRSLKIAQAGLRSPNKPLAIFMFAGPTGTGKSESIRALAKAIHDDPEYLCRVDCNLLSESHTAASLSGSPPGYVGSTGGHTVLNRKIIEGKPGKPGLLVFEEIEKAHFTVWDTLLGIFDKAALQMNNGVNKINFANTIIIMTSNVGARELADSANGTRAGFALANDGGKLQLSGQERRNIVFTEMKRLFKPEFINRIDDVVVFRWLDQQEQMKVAAKFVDELSDRLFAQHQHSLFHDEAALAFLVSKGFDLANGARALQRAIRKHLEDPLADVLLDDVLPHEHCFIHVTYRDGDEGLTFTYEEVPVLRSVPRPVRKPRARKAVDPTPVPVPDEEQPAA